MMEQEVFDRAQYHEAAEYIRGKVSHLPTVGMILGSGLSAFAEQVADAVRIPYADIPNFAVPTVAGHVGQLVIGELERRRVMIMQGRNHAYEGVSLQRITFPIRVMHELGVRVLIITNAAGGVNPAFRAGDLMLITDHIGLMAMVGANPLWGPNDDSMGPRFPAMSHAYDRGLRDLAERVAQEQGVLLRKGVYAGLSGPAFETPAEVRFLRTIGADATGMSTVPEVLVARHMDMKVLGFSGISNVAVSDEDSPDEANHEEVLSAGKELVPKLLRVLRGVLAGLDDRSAVPHSPAT